MRGESRGAIKSQRKVFPLFRSFFFVDAWARFITNVTPREVVYLILIQDALDEWFHSKKFPTRNYNANSGSISNVHWIWSKNLSSSTRPVVCRFYNEWNFKCFVKLEGTFGSKEESKRKFSYILLLIFMAFFNVSFSFSSSFSWC